MINIKYYNFFINININTKYYNFLTNININIKYYNFPANSLNKNFNPPIIQTYNLLNYNRYGNENINFIRLERMEIIEWRYI